MSADGVSKSIESIFGSFNRYWLRYGPSVAGTILTVAYWANYRPQGSRAAKALNDFLENGVGPTTALVGLAIALGISYVFTWPILMLHSFRFSAEDQQKLADHRGKAQLPSSGISHEAEYIETVRHMREHGNALACFGLTILQVSILLQRLFAPGVGMRVSMCCICILSILPISIGIVVWGRAVRLESRQTEPVLSPCVSHLWKAMLACVVVFGAGWISLCIRCK